MIVFHDRLQQKTAAGYAAVFQLLRLFLLHRECFFHNRNASFILQTIKSVDLKILAGNISVNLAAGSRIRVIDMRPVSFC